MWTDVVYSISRPLKSPMRSLELNPSAATLDVAYLRWQCHKIEEVGISKKAQGYPLRSGV